MVAIDSSTPVNLTGMDFPGSGSISYRDDPGLSTSLHGRDGDFGSVPTPAKTKPSVLRLAFPFGARRKAVPSSQAGPPSPIPKSAPELPVRHTFTFTPSRLRFSASEEATSDPRAATSCSAPVITPEDRPQPRHHGHSRHSLLLTKLVWSRRHGQHPEGSSDIHASGESSSLASGNTSPKAFPSHARRAPLLRCLSSFYSEEKPDQSPLTMFPRQGDVAALRDPYCARADRSFAPVPLWTLNKIVFVLALLLPKPKQEEDYDDAASEMSFNGTESTLVDSDSEWETSTACSSRQDASSDLEDASCSSYSGSPVAKCDLLSLAARQVNREPDASTVHMANPAWLCKFYRDPRPESIKLSLSLSRNRHQRNHSVSLSSTVWPSSWYGLWELLIELAHRDRATNVGERGRTPEARGSRKAVKVPQPKEFRWLKMLGKAGTASKASTKGGAGVKHAALSPVLSPVYEPSHSACG